MIGPLQILESLCKYFLCCGETLTLLCNLTRIEGMAEELAKNTHCIRLIKNQFYDICRKIDSKACELGGLMMHLLVNLSRITGFTRFMVTEHHGYFMHPVLLNLLTNRDIFGTPSTAAWPFLKNLAMTDAGRDALMDHIGVFLGPILYPIAGPEKISEEDTKQLPPEVQYLPEDKTRVKEKKIRDCILHTLFSLCRFRDGREKLREFNVYQVLKHYHLWEEDPELTEKLESLVNILIRREESEILFDDLMEGLKIST